MVSNATRIIEQIEMFRAQCSEGDFTDTGEVWDLLDWIVKTCEME